MNNTSTLSILKEKINKLIIEKKSEQLNNDRKEEIKIKIKELRKQIEKINLEIKYETQQEIKNNSLKINIELSKRIDELENNKKQISSLFKIKAIEYEIAKCKIEMLQNDPEFILRNMLFTKLCPNISKGKKCNFEGCTFAHSESQIRKPICLFNVYNICNYSNNCIHDHSSIEPPKLPIQAQPVNPEVKKLVQKNEDENKDEFKYYIKTDSKTFYFKHIDGSINYILNEVNSN